MAFQNQGAGAFRHHEAVAVLREGLRRARLRRVVLHREAERQRKPGSGFRIDEPSVATHSAASVSPRRIASRPRSPARDFIRLTLFGAGAFERLAELAAEEAIANPVSARAAFPGAVVSRRAPVEIELAAAGGAGQRFRRNQSRELR